MLTFSQLQSEIKRGATRDQGGPVFDDAVKVVINRAIKRLANESNWRSLRRSTYITTSTTYTAGSGSCAISVGSDSLTVTGASFISSFKEQVRESENQTPSAVGRMLSLEGSNTTYTVRRVYSETIVNLDKVYDGDSALTTGTYEMLPQEEYILPMEVSHRCFLWHEALDGTPYLMHYVTDQDFFDLGLDRTTQDTPTSYRMWNGDMLRQNLTKGTIVRVVSTSSLDTAVPIRIMGAKGNTKIPANETISTDSSNGTTATEGSTIFTRIDSIVKGATTQGNVTVTVSSGNTILAQIPSSTTAQYIQYRRIQLYPLPSTRFDLNIGYYKDPYDLVDDNDVHELGAEFDQAIIFLSTALLKLENNMKEGQDMFKLYKDEIKNLRRNNIDKIDWLPILRRPYQSRGAFQDARLSKFLTYRQVGSSYGRTTRG